MESPQGYAESMAFLHSLEQFESQMSNKGQISVKEMTTFLLEVQRSLEIPNLFDLGNDNSVPLSIYTRMAALISWWLMNYQQPLTTDELTELIGRKQLVTSIFYASGFAGTAHLQLYLSRKDQSGGNILSGDRLVLLLAVSALDEVSDELFEAMLQLNAEFVVVLMLGWLNATSVLTTRGENHRARLIRMSGALAGIQAGRSFIDLFLNAWMYCSYALIPDKHQLKKNLNQMVKNYAATFEVKPEPAAYLPAAKPTMVVILERFHSSHAMHRCYRPYIESVKKHFNIVAIVEEQHIDEASDGLFAEVIKVENIYPDIENIITHINRIKPQAIYYPSLGMCRWTVILCNMRLAPVQFMSLGHPATSYSTEIDYLLSMPLDEEQYKVYSERLIFSHADRFVQSPHPQLEQLKRNQNKFSDKVVHIAVNCTAMKLNALFFELCNRLIKESEKPIQFHFFPGIRGYHYDAIRTMIRKQIPSAHVYPHMRYDEFLAILSSCHISLATYPFGNANSTADALLLDLPVVCMIGPEPSSRTDEFVIKSLGAPDYLICDTPEKYFSLSMKLINDPDFYAQTVKAIQSVAIASRLFDKTTFVERDDIGWIFAFAYHYHAQIQQSNAKAVRYQDVAHAKLPSWN